MLNNPDYGKEVKNILKIDDNSNKSIISTIKISEFNSNNNRFSKLFSLNYLESLKIRIQF